MSGQRDEAVALLREVAQQLHEGQMRVITGPRIEVFDGSGRVVGAQAAPRSATGASQMAHPPTSLLISGQTTSLAPAASHPSLLGRQARRVNPDWSRCAPSGGSLSRRTGIVVSPGHRTSVPSRLRCIRYCPGQD